MSESVQKLLIYFGAAMVGMIALLLALQIGFGELVEDEPQMINPRSLVVAAFFAAGIAYLFAPGAGNRDDNR
jgi:NADH:ubiquinone oxidoreductase subunit 6 (subunit J)